jgi:hypothetical protein
MFAGEQTLAPPRRQAGEARDCREIAAARGTSLYKLRLGR